MAKLKVRELAEELNISNDDVKSFLASKGVEVKRSDSSLDEEAVAAVRANFKKAEAPKAESKPEAPKAEVKPQPKAESKPEAAKPEAKTEEAPKKKKNIILSIMVLIQKDLTSIQEKNLKVMVNIFLVTQDVLLRIRE